MISGSRRPPTPWTASTSRATRVEGCRPRPRRLRHHRDQRPRRFRHGRLAGDRAVRRRHPADATANSRRMLSITLGSKPGLHAAAAELRWHAGRYRRAAGGRLRSPADHQHRHRAPQGRRRSDRRRHHHGADGMLQRRHRRACHRTRVRPGQSRRRSLNRTAVVAFGGNALVTDAEHDSIPEQYQTVCRDRLASRRFGRAGLAARRLARQRTAGRLHPAPVGTVRVTRWTRCPSTTPSPTPRALSATCSSRR